MIQLAGNFRKFPVKAIPVAAIFIMPGEWDLYLLRHAIPIDRGWRGSVLASGKVTFRKKGKMFVADPVTITIMHTGLCKTYLLSQNGFKIMGSVGTSEADMVIPFAGQVMGDTLIIESMSFYTREEDAPL
jgi:hypothetical protein